MRSGDSNFYGDLKHQAQKIMDILTKRSPSHRRHQRVWDGDLGNTLDYIDWKFYSAIGGITTFENASRLGVC